MSKKYEIEGHDIYKFQQYYIQDNGRGFSLEEPPNKIYYFNKYGGWKDEIDGKVFYYDQDCNPWIENLPSDIDELEHSQEQDAQEATSQSDRYVQELQQDLKDYSASSDENCEGDEEDEQALEEMTSSSEQEFDDQENAHQQNKIQEGSQQNQDKIFTEQEQNEQNLQNEQADQEGNEEQKNESNNQTDETKDSEHFRQEYINELVDVIQQNSLETTCIHIEKIPADLKESDLLESFGVQQQDQENIFFIFYGPLEKVNLDDEYEEEGDNHEEQKETQGQEYYAKNAVLVVSSKEFAKQLVQNEGKPIANSQDKSLYLDVLTESKDYYPMPGHSDSIYVKLLEVIKYASASSNKNSKIQLELVDSSDEDLFKGFVQQYQNLSILNSKVIELNLNDNVSWRDTLISLWNYLYNTDLIGNIKNVNLI